MADLQQHIADTRPDAAEVSSIDVDALVRRGRRQRRWQQAGAGMALLLAIVAVGVGVRQTVLPPVPPDIADDPDGVPVGDAPIGLLDTPAGPEDQLPAAVVADAAIPLDAEARETARLARRTPTRRYYLYRGDTPREGARPGEQVVCVAIVGPDDQSIGGACGGLRVRNPDRAQLLLMKRGTDHGAVGVVTDGATTTAEIHGFEGRLDGSGYEGRLDDVPVVNNLFVVDEAVDEEAAAAGRSPDGFCSAMVAADEARDIVGDEENMQRLEAMAESAPLEIAGEVYLVWDHLRVHVSPDDPDAGSLDNYPAPVQEAITRVEDYRTTTCGDPPGGTATPTSAG